MQSESGRSPERVRETQVKGKRSRKCKFLGAFIIVIHVLFTCAVFLGFECRRYYNINAREYLLVPCLGVLIASICVALILTAIIIDPGVFPKPSREEQELEAQIYNKERLKADFDLQLGVRRKIVLYGQCVEANYCFECRHFKELRTRHCKICDRCIVRHDHHCIVLGCCVGIRNFAVFYYLQVFLLLFYIYVMVHSVFILFINLKTKSIYTSLLWSPSMWLITLTNLIVIVTGLGHVLLFPFTYCYLMGKDRTSRELFFVIQTKGAKCQCVRIEKGFAKDPDTEKTNCLANIMSYLCISPPPTLRRSPSLAVTPKTNACY